MSMKYISLVDKRRAVTIMGLMRKHVTFNDIEGLLLYKMLLEEITNEKGGEENGRGEE